MLVSDEFAIGYNRYGVLAHIFERKIMLLWDRKVNVLFVASVISALCA